MTLDVVVQPRWARMNLKLTYQVSGAVQIPAPSVSPLLITLVLTMICHMMMQS